MKQYIVSLLLVLFVFPSFLMAQKKLDAEQLKLRSELVSFLKVEGFSPSIDSDGNIKFKIKNQMHILSVSESDKNPFFVSLFREFSYPSEYTKDTFIAATVELNRYKAVKIVCLEENFRVVAEMYVKDSEPVKEAFYKISSNIELLVLNVLSECDKVD